MKYFQHVGPKVTFNAFQTQSAEGTILLIRVYIPDPALQKLCLCMLMCNGVSCTLQNLFMHGY